MTATVLNRVKLQIQYHESSREIRDPTGRSRTSHIKPRGPLGSSPLRSDGSRNGQAGEAGPVEHRSAEAKSLKTKGQGTVRLPPQWATIEAARIKDHSHDKLT